MASRVKRRRLYTSDEASEIFFGEGSEHGGKGLRKRQLSSLKMQLSKKTQLGREKRN